MSGEARCRTLDGSAACADNASAMSNVAKKRIMVDSLEWRFYPVVRSTMMKLTCYALDANPPTIRAAPQTRPWMDGVIDNHAYRCLPLSIANSYGWDILAPFGFRAQWSGEAHPRSLALECDDASIPPRDRVASHFGYGIVTFQLAYLFRTEPGWDLIASGPYNRPKDGIAALTGVIETDWLSFPFTMNWQMTRPGK